MKLTSYIATYKYNGFNDDLLPIINKMMPAINKYARSMYFLEYDDAKQELILALILSVQKIQKYDNEYQCLSYLNHALRIKYLELCHSYLPKKEYETEIDSNIIESSIIDENNTSMFSDAELYYDLINFLKNQPTHYKNILYLILVKDLKDKEIAAKYSVSRQYINRIKKKAFKDFQKYLQHGELR